ncbi:TIGR03759 family integrating conjugative element protein [Ectopseudomonas guguanensis]|uniref:TIGR03759 family integrating conjugative element protein n=1 Tax=Ectopseudomonas guguanensis TaxID=1198456 RepID=UPI002579184A|nr:TIGR03759 family integrating conjugative element protein [Pseudomonas guguanensis]WJH55973.1 TIGR03759 family integrating conjugative element protein [Pseudomonas guguanensis]
MKHATVALSLLAALALSAPQSLLAQQSQAAATNVAPSRERPAPIARSDEDQARDWGLRPEEWVRYRELMQGPLGLSSPNLDPLTALGIEARSDEERRRFADLQVQIEARRVEKLLAYQRAYDAAWQRLAPGMQRVNLPGAGAAPPGMTQADERIAVFIKDACSGCDETVQRLQAEGASFDIYVVGSRGDDALIREWARRTRIDPAKVRSGHITLNHDGGRWLSLGVQGDLPAVVGQVGGQWQRQQ